MVYTDSCQLQSQVLYVCCELFIHQVPMIHLSVYEAISKNHNIYDGTHY